MTGLLFPPPLLAPPHATKSTTLVIPAKSPIIRIPLVNLDVVHILWAGSIGNGLANAKGELALEVLI